MQFVGCRNITMCTLHVYMHKHTGTCLQEDISILMNIITLSDLQDSLPRKVVFKCNESYVYLKFSNTAVCRLSDIVLTIDTCRSCFCFLINWVNHSNMVTMICCKPGLIICMNSEIIILMISWDWYHPWHLITNHTSRLVCRNDPDLNWLPQSLYYI